MGARNASWRITVLADNTAGGAGLLAEHGLALWIETDGKRFLFDTGAGRVLRGNACWLGVELDAADAVLLSHGHYDHTGGLGRVVRASPGITVYAHPQALEPKFGRERDGTCRKIGLPDGDLHEVRNHARLVEVTGPVEIGGGLWLTGPVPRTTTFEDTGGPFFLDPACRTPDPMTDDQAAFLPTPAGTVVILGCAHAGVINTLRYIRSLTADARVHTVLGGMHLGSAGPERMDRTVAELRALDVLRLIPCHCTGLPATARFCTDFPKRCQPCRTGSVIE